MKTRFRKRVGSGPVRLNVSHCEQNGLSHSWSVGTTNKTGLGLTANSKRGTTIAARGTGLSAHSSKGSGSGLGRFLLFWIMIPFYVLKFAFQAVAFVVIGILALVSS